MIPSKQTHDVLAGHRWCLQDFGAVPRLGVYHGEPAFSSRRGRQVLFTAEFLAFKGTFGMGAHVFGAGPPGTQGGGGTRQRISGDEFPARPGLRRGGRLQHPAGRLAGTTANVRVHKLVELGDSDNPPGVRLLIRREPRHPGAQPTFEDIDGTASPPYSPTSTSMTSRCSTSGTAPTPVSSSASKPARTPAWPTCHHTTSTSTRSGCNSC
jgi:hypothetical protein